MKKTINKTLLCLVLAVVAIVCGFVASLTGVRADNAVNLTTVNYLLEDGAYVRMVYDDQDNPVLDGESNGIKFVARMATSEYEAIKDKGVSFGIIVLPYDYVAGKTITKSLFFGENREFYFGESDYVANGKKVANFVTDTLAPKMNGETVEYYYYSASIVDMQPANVSREFVALTYVMQEDANGVISYDLKALNTENIRSMSYVAQRLVEMGNYGETVNNALNAYYVDGRTNSIDVNYVISYDGVEVKGSKQVTADLGAQLGTEDLVALLREQGVADESDCDYASSILMQNGVGTEKIKVYANDNTKEDITITFNAKEVASYDVIKGYYKNSDGTEFVLKSDKTVYGANSEGTYKNFVDGKLVIDVEGEKLFGDYDSSTGKINLDYDGQKVELSESLYLSSNSMLDMVGCYKDESGLFVELKKDGSLVYDKAGFISEEVDGAFAVYYDELAEEFKIVVSAGATASSKEIDLTTQTFAIGEKEFSKIILAGQDAYKEFANTYVVMRYFPNETVKTQARLTFTEDGNVIYFSPEGNTVLCESLGKYIILENNQIQLKLKSGYVDTIAVADYTIADDKNTLTMTLGGVESTFESVHVEEADVYTALAGKTFGFNNNLSRGGKYQPKDTLTDITDAESIGIAGWYKMVVSDGSWVSHNPTTSYAYTIEKINNYMGKFEYYCLANKSFYQGCYQLIDGMYFLYFDNAPKSTATCPAGEGLKGEGSSSNAYYIISDIARIMNEGSASSEVVVDQTQSAIESSPVTMADIAGYYKVTDCYGTPGTTWDSSNWYAGFRLYDDGTDEGRVYYNGNASYGTYTLTPDENNPAFGKVNIALEYDKNIQCYYARIDGEIILRMIVGNLGFSSYVDFKKDGTKFSTWDVFTALAGDGTGETGTSVQYCIDANTVLDLQNDGKFAKFAKEWLLPGNTTKVYYGAECKLKVGGQTLFANYDLLPQTATSGLMKIYVYGTEYHVRNNSVVTTITGSYEKVEDIYVVSFNYNGTNYVLPAGGSSYVNEMLAGVYAGLNTLEIKANSTLNYGGETALDYTISQIDATNGSISFYSEEKMDYLTATYEILAGSVRVTVFDGGFEFVYVLSKAQVKEDLYARFAGSYTSADWYKATGGEGVGTKLLSGITITLNADKTFTINDPDGAIFVKRDGLAGSTTGKYEIQLVDGVYCLALYFDGNAFVEYGGDTGADWKPTVSAYNYYYERYFVGCFDADGNVQMNFRVMRESRFDALSRTYVKQVEQA